MNGRFLKKIILEELYKTLKEQQQPLNIPGEAGTAAAPSYEQLKLTAATVLKQELSDKQKINELNNRMAYDIAGIVGTAGIAIALHSAKEKLVEMFVKFGANKLVALRVFDLLEEGAVHKGGHPIISYIIKILETRPAVFLKILGYAGKLIKVAPIISILADSKTIIDSIGEMINVYEFETGTDRKIRGGELNYQTGQMDYSKREQGMQGARASAQQRTEAGELIIGLDRQIQQYGWDYVNGITRDKNKLANAFGVMNQFTKDYWKFYPAVYDLISGIPSREGQQQRTQYDAARRRR